MSETWLPHRSTIANLHPEETSNVADEPQQIGYLPETVPGLGLEGYRASQPHPGARPGSMSRLTSICL